MPSCWLTAALNEGRLNDLREAAHAMNRVLMLPMSPAALAANLKEADRM